MSEVGYRLLVVGKESQQIREGIKMEKIVLVSTSTGQRGQDGKQKVYEIVVNENVVTLRWGKAEEDRKQTKREFFGTPQRAKMFAEDKMWEKVAKGYRVALRA
jgi:predicted DNA-binding WGR domain protein